MAIAKHKSRQRELHEGRALARRVLRGDRGAFALLYTSYEGRLYRFCHRLTGSDAVAAGLVEATFARALATLDPRRLDSLDFAAHLHGTARTLAYERHGNGGPPRLDAGGEHAREVSAANQRLAPRQRMALALRDLEGRPDDEIALVLGVDGPAIADLVARARLRLRSELHLPTAVAGCRDRLAEVSAYADGTLPGEGRAALEEHLEGCADCRAALFALREAALRYRALPVPVPPGELSSRISVALGAAGLPAHDPAAATADPAMASGGRQTAVAAAMAALVVVGAGVTVVAARDGRDGNKSSRAPAPPPPPPQPTPRSADAAVPASAAPGETGVGRVTVAPPRPPALHHLRAGPRRVPRAPIPAPPATGSTTSSPASSPPAASAEPPPTPPATAPPLPPATMPEPKRQIPVEILPPVAPPHTPAPADVPPPRPEPPPPPDPSQTTTT